MGNGPSTSPLLIISPAERVHKFWEKIIAQKTKFPMKVGSLLESLTCVALSVEVDVGFSLVLKFMKL
jgi:hypothetical protein